MRVGGDMLLRTSSLVGTLTLATAIAARVGVVEVAAHQVASQLWLFLALTIDSLAVAAQALVATEAGRGVPGGARRVADRVIAWGFALGVAQALLFLLAKPLLVRLFTSDPAVVAALDSVYLFIVVMQPLNAAVFVLDGVFMGAEEFRFLARAMVMAAVVASVLLLLVLPLGWGLLGVWWGMIALMLVRGLTLVLRYRAPFGVLTRG
jgi:MATE family multidrug resistance protein